MKTKKMGRPKILKAGTKCNMYLDKTVIEMLARLGDGSPSRGVRVLIEFHTKITGPLSKVVSK